MNKTQTITKKININSWDNINTKKIRAVIIPILKKINFANKEYKKDYAIRILNNNNSQTERKITICLNILNELIHDKNSNMNLEIKVLTLRNFIYN